MPSESEVPQFISKSRFFALLGCCFVTGQRFIERGVLQPDAMLDAENPLFIHSGEKIAEAHRAIQNYRKNLRISKYNLTN